MRYACVIAFVGHVCRIIVEARRSRNGAEAGVTRTCLDIPPERSVLASRRGDRTLGHTESSAFHVKPACERSASHADGGGPTVPSPGEGRALTVWHCRPRSSASSATHGKKIRPQGRRCMDVIAHTGAPAHREMEHAISTQHVHVSRETRRRPCPLTTSACLSHVQRARALLPFTVSSCAVEGTRGGPEARRDTSGLSSVAITKPLRLLRGDTGEGGVR